MSFEPDLTLGEYMRRLRHKANVSLFDLSQRTGLAYTHLSRIENDSTVPNPATVVKISEALDGDLKIMLELAKCLPRAILDRITAKAVSERAGTLSRAAHGMSEGPRPGASPGDHLEAWGETEEEAEAMAEAISLLPKMKPHHRKAVIGLIRTLYHEDDGPSG